MRANHTIGEAMFGKPVLCGRLGTRLFATSSRRAAQSLFKVFPESFPHGGPPADPFAVEPKRLRREYRLLQSEHHPDILAQAPPAPEQADGYSSIVNRAYTVIRNPYTRLAHVIELHHPHHLDITQDEVAKRLIAQFQTSSRASALGYKQMLMLVLDAHESLEMAELERELEELEADNDRRVHDATATVEALLRLPQVDWDRVVMEAIKLKYWVNIQNAIKEWQQGKPVHLTH